MTLVLAKGQLTAEASSTENDQPTSILIHEVRIEGRDIIYTVIESGRRRGLDPYACLKAVLTRLPTMTNHQIPEVTPAAWAKARRLLPRPAAS